MRITGSTSPRLAAWSIRAVLALACLGAVALWWVQTSPNVGSAPGSSATSLGELTGMVDGVLVCAQVLLVARLPWFEHAVGFDRLVAWHRTLGGSVIILTLTHVALIVIGGTLTDQLTAWAEFWTVTLPQPDVLAALGGTALLLVVGATAIGALRRRIAYEWWYWLHTTTYFAVFLSFAHQINAGAHFVGNPLARLAWAALYLATAAAVIVWRLLLPLAAQLRHRVRVERVVPESAGVVSVWLRGRQLDELGVRAGQFMLFRFLDRRHAGSAHPYSVSAVPRRDRMRITVGALGNHSAALGGLRRGTPVLVEGPFGHFTTERARSDRVLLVAGGAGIGPIAALTHQFAREGRDVAVLHRAPTAAHLPLSRELSARRGVRFVPVLGRRNELGYDPISAAALLELVPDVAEREVFICGSPGLTEAVVRSLRDSGLAGNRIHHEELSLT